MADTPDIGKIIGLIMENPSLIAQISALARSEGVDSHSPTDDLDEEDSREKAPPADAEPAVAPPQPQAPARANRQRLLSAMKPYLSEERRRAIDSMASIGEILDAMKRR